jgi:hypothetical protein
VPTSLVLFLPLQYNETSECGGSFVGGDEIFMRKTSYKNLKKSPERWKQPYSTKLIEEKEPKTDNKATET